VEDLCDINEEMLEEDGMSDTNTIIIVGWNSIIEDESYRNIAGPHDLGEKNRRVKLFINFWEWNGLIPNNTCFRKRKRKLYTWKAQEIEFDIR
jgi:hypothetical protein